MSCEIYVRQPFTANHILFKLYFNATYKQGVFDHFVMRNQWYQVFVHINISIFCDLVFERSDSLNNLCFVLFKYVLCEPKTWQYWLKTTALVYALKNPNYFKCSKSSQCPSRYFRQKANLLLPLILLTQCLSDSMIFVSLMFLLSTFNIFVVIIKGFGKSSFLSLICKKGHYEHKIWDKMFLHQKSNL